LSSLDLISQCSPFKLQNILVVENHLLQEMMGKNKKYRMSSKTQKEQGEKRLIEIIKKGGTQILSSF
jgi:hypothetical protein